MHQSYEIRRDAYVLPSDLPIPGVGRQSVNAFLFRDAEPILIDTGMPFDRPEFLDALWRLIDPADLRWVMVTHDDRDHSGAAARRRADRGVQRVFARRPVSRRLQGVTAVTGLATTVIRTGRSETVQ